MSTKAKTLKRGDPVQWTTHRTNRARGRIATVHRGTVYTIFSGLFYVQFGNQRLKSVPLAQIQRVPPGGRGK